MAEQARKDQETGALVLRRNAAGGYPGIAIYAADGMADDAYALDVLAQGITIRLIDVSESPKSGEKIAHVAISANEMLAIEREENVTHANVERAKEGADLRGLALKVPNTRSPIKLAKWLEEARRALCMFDSAVRDLKEESRRGRATGAHHRGNAGYMDYCMIQKAINKRKNQATQWRELIRSGTEQLKVLNREKSEEGAKDFHRLFYDTARNELAESTIEKIVKKAKATTTGPLQE